MAAGPSSIRCRRPARESCSCLNFSRGFNGSVDSIGPTPAEQQMRALRAINQVGRLPYQQANCDTLATYAETGTAWSPQAVGLLALAGAVGLVIWGSRN